MNNTITMELDEYNEMKNRLEGLETKFAEKLRIKVDKEINSMKWFYKLLLTIPGLIIGVIMGVLI